MAMEDWNHDGSNDRRDDYLEHTYLHNNEGETGGRRSSGRGISCLGVIGCVVAGFLEMTAIIWLLGIEPKNIPSIVLMILWFVCAMATELVVLVH